MRLQAAIEGRLDKYMDDESRSVASATRRAVTEVTNETKNLARGHVASRLGRRAGFLVTSRVYDNGPVDKAGLIYSRWKRKGPGAKPTDVLAAHAYGAVIEPRQSRFLYIPLTKGRLSRRQRREFQDGVGSKDVALIPFTDRRGNLAYLVREKSKRGRLGRAIALLVQRVELRSRIDLDPIYRLAERSLVTRLVGYLDRPAA